MSTRIIYKSILFFLTLVMTPASSFAQIDLGVYVGSVTNKFEGDNLASALDLGFRMNSSVSAGLVVDIPVTNDVFITLIPAYKDISGTAYEENEEYNEQIENEEEPTVPQYLDVSKMSLKYLVLPIIMKIISDNERWQFMGGLETAFALSTKLKPLDTGEEVDIDSHVKALNLSAIFGLGYRFKIKKLRFAFDLMYTQGLINMSEGYRIDALNVPRVKSTTGETRLTWYLPNKSIREK